LNFVTSLFIHFLSLLSHSPLYFLHFFLILFFLAKIKWYSFKLIEYIRYNYIFNFAENLKDESMNKLTLPKLKAYNGKIPTTNNMINLKSPEYPCFWICNVDIQIIDWIWNWLKFWSYNMNQTNTATIRKIKYAAQDDEQHSATLIVNHSYCFLLFLTTNVYKIKRKNPIQS
jgi:hypothetical protein